MVFKESFATERHTQRSRPTLAMRKTIDAAAKYQDYLPRKTPKLTKEEALVFVPFEPILWSLFLSEIIASQVLLAANFLSVRSLNI